jgi:hypothetical protein
MEQTEFDFSDLSPEQLTSLNDEQKAVFQMLSSTDRKFFGTSFSPKDLPNALIRKGEIMKRNRSQSERLSALQEKFVQIDAQAKTSAVGNDTDSVETALAGIAAVVGIGAVAGAISTDGSASWKGVPPRVIANALETTFDNGRTTDTDVQGAEENLQVTIYLKPPDGGKYVPAITVLLNQVQEVLQVNVSDLTSESLWETAREGGKKFLDLAMRGLLLWQHRSGIGEAVTMAQNALDTVFDAAQVAKDLNLESRVWQVIKETADAREKAYAIEAERERQAYQELIDAWDNYYKCPRCGEPYSQSVDTCRICGRGRNIPPIKADPRQTS